MAYQHIMVKKSICSMSRTQATPTLANIIEKLEVGWG